jgi:hypothetical protein
LIKKIAQYFIRSFAFNPLSVMRGLIGSLDLLIAVAVVIVLFSRYGAVFKTALVASILSGLLLFRVKKQWRAHFGDGVVHDVPALLGLRLAFTLTLLALSGLLWLHCITHLL